MWKLSSIAINNIISFRKAELDIDQNVATLIFGRNEDNASQPCNGSGKSSLIEAISFALTGEQLRKVKSMEEIINDQADEASVSLVLTNDALDTKLTINRHISRKSPQVIQVIKQTGPCDTDTEEVVQPTVADYNKYILEEIGLSKEDIYNNFILCDNKYESFFDTSDRNKKEVINRFTNGILVDDAIERVAADMEPMVNALQQQNSKIAGIEGSIKAIETELENVEEKNLSAKAEKEQRIQCLDEEILRCREKIEFEEGQLTKCKVRLSELDKCHAEISEVYNSDEGLATSQEMVGKILEKFNTNCILTDYTAQAQGLRDKLKVFESDMCSYQKQLKDTENQLADARKVCSEKKNNLEKYSAEIAQKDSNYQKSIDKLTAELDDIDKRLDEIDAVVEKSKAKQTKIKAEISGRTVSLGGAVICPKCDHRFFPGIDVAVEEIEEAIHRCEVELKAEEKEMKRQIKASRSLDDEAADKDAEISELEQQQKNIRKQFQEEKDKVADLVYRTKNTERRVEQMNTNIDLIKTKMEKTAGRLEVLRERLFSEAAGFVEKLSGRCKEFLDRQPDTITFYENQMAQNRELKKKLIEEPDTDFKISLNQSLRDYKEKLESAQIDLGGIQSEYDKLQDLQLNFAMFKSYIANKKITALSYVVNDFLEKIGSDIRLKLEGFTMTKTGKLRDKISVQVMRDGVDCGSYHKFSGGEKARLNLACILALHTLVNSNCEDGKGLDFIIIDELLDKSDEVGIATYCDALNKLGQTSLLITQGAVSEGYPHKLLISKKQGVSTISKR